jgi:tRNA 2-thiouridine synthesizing protein A
MTDMPTADKTLDCRDMQCPIPILKAKKEIQKIEVGQVLEVLSNDPGSKEDFPRWAKRTGNELVDVVDDGDFAHYFIKRKV